MKVNQKPAIIPEIRDWHGGTGAIGLTAESRILIDSANDSSVEKVYAAFAEALKSALGFCPQVKRGGAADSLPGDILVDAPSDDIELGEEGYNINISDVISIRASQNVGYIWASKTLLQLFRLSEDGFIAKGTVNDAPLYKVRGFMLDVGRKPFKIQYLYDVVRRMSFYKMNDFHVHLNDNYIWLETLEDPSEAYSAFRLESKIKGLTAQDVFYSKKEFSEFIKAAKELYGVNVVPEIDVPAHALALTKVRPDLMLGKNHRDAEHLDLSNPDTLPFVQSVFSEYIEGADPVFCDSVVHIGTDEYNKAYAEVFRKFSDDMIGYLQDEGRTVRLWGSLTMLKGKTPVRSKNVQINIWNSGWGEAGEMYDCGFKLINTLDSHLYIVPKGTCYRDRLNQKHLYKKWKPNVMGRRRFNEGDPQILGAAFCLWNDMIWKKDNGLNEDEILGRAYEALPAVSEKLWGRAKDKKFKDFLVLSDRLK